MKKYILSGIVLVVLIGYVLYTHGDLDNDEAPIILPSTSTSPTTSAGPSSSSSPGATVTQGKYKNGTYTGKVADAVYGKIQVKVLIQNGSIADVTYLQFPNSPGHTTEVSTAVLPVLKQEAISAQDANVQIISGATQTSEGFQQTLADALAQAS